MTMRRSVLVVGLFLAWVCGSGPAWAEPMVEVFESVWAEARSNIYPGDRAALFTDDQHAALLAKARAATTPDELAAIVNPFLERLHVSHTRFYTDSDLEYYMFGSLFTTHCIDRPKVAHIGAQFAPSPNGYYVRTVLDGYPAARAGLRRGDLVVTADDAPFLPVRSFTGRKTVRLQIRRAGATRTVDVVPVVESFHLSLERATNNSVRILQPRGPGGPAIGYLHLWSGTHEKILADFTAAVTGPLAGVDGLILDLRDGFGGAWQDYLDPFYPDRRTYFVATRIDRTGQREVIPNEAVPPHAFYAGPMVVLINEGVRSGKEALAFQFKKTHRATLVGAQTAGFFVGGRGFFVDRPRGWLLYLSSLGLLLDGQDLEGCGVSPDVAVPWPWTVSRATDPQFDCALERMMELSSRAGPKSAQPAGPAQRATRIPVSFLR